MKKSKALVSMSCLRHHMHTLIFSSISNYYYFIWVFYCFLNRNSFQLNIEWFWHRNCIEKCVLYASSVSTGCSLLCMHRINLILLWQITNLPRIHWYTLTCKANHKIFTITTAKTKKTQ